MRKENKTYRWLWNGLMAGCLLLLWACASSSEPDEPKPLEKPVLKLYVYAPNRPIVTRAGGDNVAASDLENEIKSLQVWVFEGAKDKDNNTNSHVGDLVGYVNLMNVTPSGEGSEITISDLSDDFIARKPTVNVYVAANVANGNCGQSLEATFLGPTLDAAFIGTNYFGLSPTVKEVPVNGLPMTGVLKEEAVSGVSPVFRVGSESGVKNVKLVRAVSKVRFVFCKSSDNTDDVAIKNIKLDANVLPNEEYLFLNGVYGTGTGEQISRIKTESGYNTSVTDLVTNVTAINSNDSPGSYSYDGVMSGQDYETLIQSGINNNEVSDVGTFYLRESDKKLTGSIIYNIGVTQREKTFSMKVADDFTRNHTWIVYGYFVSKGDLMLNIVDVKDWVSSRDEEEVHNW